MSKRFRNGDPAYKVYRDGAPISGAIHYPKANDLVSGKIKPGDTYQEIHGSEHLNVLSYEGFLLEKEKTRKFDAGE
jgi:hypothetical protein